MKTINPTLILLAMSMTKEAVFKDISRRHTHISLDRSFHLTRGICGMGGFRITTGRLTPEISHSASN